jgi:pimeloyl-ACP methyl ester carboxylesterase
MEALGDNRFSVVGHDTGFAIAYALAADHPDRIERVALAEIPGPPLPSSSPPLFVPTHLNNKLWHLAFNRVAALPEQLVAGREDVFFGYELAIQGGALDEDVIAYYVQQLSSPDALRGSFGWYRALDATLAQNDNRKERRLACDVLAIGGAESYGPLVGEAMKPLAEHVESVVIADAGHWVAEQNPSALLGALMSFMSPRDVGLGATMYPGGDGRRSGARG